MSNAVAHPIVAADQKISFSVALGWGIGTLGMSLLFQAVSVLLLSYMTDYLGIAAVTAGLLISASKLFDAFIDPFVGAMSDRTRSRWGRRRPYLLAGGAICTVSFLLMFNIPVLPSQTARIVLVELVLLLFAMGYAGFNIPYMAMPAEMSTSPHERTYLMSFRISAVAVGSLFASAVGPWLVTAGGGGASGYRLMAIADAAVVGGASLVCFLMTSKARFTPEAAKTSHSVATQFKLAIENKPFINLIPVKLCQLLSGGVSLASAPYIFLQILKSNFQAMGVYFLVYFLAMLAGQPFFVWACRRFGKKQIYIWTGLAVAAVYVSWLLAGPGDSLLLTWGRGVAIGFLSGATLLIIQGMLVDTIQYDHVRTGLNREGVFAGVYITVEKVAGAFSAGIVGMILGAFGYISSSGQHVIQPETALRGVYIVALLPAALMLVSLLLMLRYHLTEQMLIQSVAAVEAAGPVIEPTL
jgi:GPH family glycoside/pentoside/hexuronide:cation symporter